MDMRTWKKVLLQWINECNYVGSHNSNIEQSDIEGFFNTYLKNLKSKENPTRNNETLLSFLKSSYPDFTPLSDENGVIHKSDYIYVYSLLLHYSCVEDPKERFHDICKNLSDDSQRCIASFFNQVLECPELSREVLRQAFVNITGVHVHSTPENRSSLNADVNTSGQINGSNSLGDLSLSTVSSQTSVNEAHSKSSVTTYMSPPSSSTARLDPSITGTPIRQFGGAQRISPSTPKTVMLESRTRELYNLRAQLETERYEKGMMELQIKQNEEQMSALTSDKKMLQVQLKELNQRSLACRFCDNDVSNSNNEADQIQKRLQKEINQKENAITILNDNLRDINEEKLVIEGRLKYAEKQIDICMKRIKELENKVDDLSAEVEQKNNAIQYLKTNKLELEQFINETRLALQSKRADLNCSSDCLDNSFSPSSTNSSPENLGFVVDKQLREKEHENEKLLEQLQNVTDSKLHLAQKLNELVKQYAHLYHLEIECGKQNENDAEEQLLLISQCMELLGSSYNREYKNVKELQEQTYKLASVNTQFNEKIATMENKMEQLQTDLDNATMLNEQISSEKLNIEETMKIAKDTINKLTMENSQLTLKLQVLSEDMIECNKQANINRQLFETEISNLNVELTKNASQTSNSEQLEIVDIKNELKSTLEMHKTILMVQSMKLSDANEQTELSQTRAIEAEEKLENVKRRHNEFIEQLKKDLNSKEIELRDQFEKSHNEKAEQYDKEIADERANYNCLQMKYQNVVDSHNALTDQLKNVQKTLENKEKELTDVNSNYESNIKRFSNQIKKMTSQYLEAETITDAAGDINTVAQDETKTQVEQLIATDQLIQKLLQMIDHLKAEIQDQKDSIQRNQLDFNDQFEKTNNFVIELKEELTTLNTKYANIVSQSDCFARQLVEEQKEKEELFTKLNRNIDGLCEIIDIKTTEINVLLERSTDAEENVKKYQNDLQISRNELTNLLEKLSLSLEELKANDMATAEVVATLNNLFKERAAGEGDQRAVKNLFNVADTANKSFDQLLRKLNLLVHNTNELEERLVTTESSYNDAIAKIEVLTQTNRQYETQIARYKTNTNELQEKLDKEITINNKKLSHQVVHLNETIKNLEDANEKLSTETGELKSTISSMEEKQAETIKRLQQYEREVANIKKTNIELSTDINNFVENECKFLETEKQMSEKIFNLQQKIKENSSLLETNKRELSKLRIAYESLQQNVEQLEKRNDELIGQINELNGAFSGAESTVSKLQAVIEEVRNECTVLQTKCEEAETRRNELLSDIEKMRSDNRDLSEQLRNKNTAKSEQDKLKNEIEYLQSEDNKLREMNEVLTKRLERTAVNLGEAQAKIMKLQRDNAQHLSKVEHNSLTVTTLQRERDSLQAKIKTLDERLLKSERNGEVLNARVMAMEEAYRTLSSQHDEAENSLADYRARQLKLERIRESQDERIRQLSATVDDTENKMVKLTLEIGGLNSELVENKAQLNERNELLKSLNSKYDNAQENLMNTNEKLSAAHVEINKLRREKNQQDAKIHDATQKLLLCNDEIKQMHTEKDGIDALCVKLRDMNFKLKDANERLINERTALEERNAAEVQNAQLELETSIKLNKKLEIEINNVQIQINDYEQELKENQLTIDCLEKDLIEKKTTIGVNEAEMMKLQNQIKAYEHNLNEKQIKIENLQAEVDQNKATIEYFSSDLKDMHEANKNYQAEYAEQVNQLQKQLQNKEDELIQLKNIQSQCATNAILDVTDEESRDVLDQERAIIAQLRLDNQVLQAKYRDAKERIAEESKLAEERVKEQRLELEGKLEKMKSKMKVLYTEEITKMKAKQEREVTAIKEQNDQLQVQFKKYEEHTRKLSSQIVRLNDKLLEYQKQNTMLSTKLKHVEESQETMSLPSTHYKRLSCLHAPTTTAPQAVNLGTNLAMEDEEGEVFNNTYLTDLKAGRMPDITTEELQYRNSLLPPHLKSAYAAQYDLDAHEDDIKDGPHSLDDSMSALLSTTNCPARKKSCGTHYKRPGPPTPSKHGGRLSFGGSTEPPREILKESYDGGNAQSSGASSVKTPARFSFFSSRFSMGSNNGAGTGGCGSSGHTSGSTGLQNQQRDERRKRNNNLLRRVHRRNMPALQRVIADAPGNDDNIPFCTSTPRKSRTYYDQRRLINYCETSSTTTPSEDCANYVSNLNNTNSTTPLTIPGIGYDNITAQFRKHSKSRNQTRVSIMHRRRVLQTTSKYYSPQVDRLKHENCSSATTSSGGNDGVVDEQEQSSQQSYRRRRRQTRTGRPRPSLYIHGGIFVKPRRAVNRQQLQQQHGAQRERFLAKLRTQRYNNFDQYRHLTSIEDSMDDCIDAFDEFKIEPDEEVNLLETVEDDEFVEELGIKSRVVLLNNDTYNLKNNNSTFDNFNKRRKNAGKLNRFGTTMVIVKHEKPILPPDFLLIDNTTTALTATFDVCDDDVALNDNSALHKIRDWAEQQHGSTVDTLSNVRQFEQMMCKRDNSWLFASGQFSQRFRNQNNDTVAVTIKPDFEKMCKETFSSAPFSIKPLQYDNNSDDSEDSIQEIHDIYQVLTQNEELALDYSKSRKFDFAEDHDNDADSDGDSIAVSCFSDTDAVMINDDERMELSVVPKLIATTTNNNSNTTLLSSCCSQENFHKASQKNNNNTTNVSVSSTISHTVYPPHNHFDRRLPIINVTHVPSRTSLVYVKKKTATTTMAIAGQQQIGGEGGGCATTTTTYLQDTSNQTITATDFIRMWHQMDNTARFIVCFAVFATLALCCNIGGIFYAHNF